MTRRRQRGVRASVHALHRALVASELKTQTALAERIADLEGLESAPRALVNKVFRGEAVDPRTLQRVAAALSVEAWTLYARSDPAEQTVVHSPDTDTGIGDRPPRERASAPRDPAPTRRRPVPAGAIVVIAALVLVAVIVAGIGNPDSGAGSPGNGVSADSTSGSVVPTQDQEKAAVNFVVLPASDDSRDLHALLSAALQQHWNAVPVAIAGELELPDAQQVAGMAGVDYVLELQITTRGRWQGVLIRLHRDGSMRAVWQTVLPLRASPARVQELMAQAAAELVSLPKAFALTSAQRDAQRKVLVGRNFLDRARTPDNVRRALTEFESAIRLDPGRAAAHAGLCEALVVEHIRSGEMARLDEASGPCKQALGLAPDLEEARLANAVLDRKAGRHADAQNHLRQVLSKSPEHVDAAMGMAELLLGIYARGEDAGALEVARELLRKAARAESEFWKIPYQQARLSYMAGDLSNALVHAERAVQLDANLLVLNNLGALRFCAGEFAAAGESFRRAGEQDPAAFVGPGQMAVIDYQLGRFDAAVEGYADALQRQRDSGVAEDHRLWGNYADALRHAGRHDRSRQAYATAIALVERQLREGDGQPLHAVSQLYYRSQLATIDPSASPPDRAQLAALTERSDGIDAMYKIYLAIIHQTQGNHGQARVLLDSGAQGCPGLALSPDVHSSSARPVSNNGIDRRRDS